jgi:hypothetical protein
MTIPDTGNKAEAGGIGPGAVEYQEYEGKGVLRQMIDVSTKSMPGLESDVLISGVNTRRRRSCSGLGQDICMIQEIEDRG